MPKSLEERREEIARIRRRRKRLTPEPRRAIGTPDVLGRRKLTAKRSQLEAGAENSVGLVKRNPYRKLTREEQLRAADIATERYEAAAAVNPGVVGRLGSNLLEDVARTATGLPVGVAQTVRHPIRTAEQVKESYAYQYGPLARGDLSEFYKRFEEHPLGPILDVSAIATGGASAAARAGAVRKAAKGAAPGNLPEAIRNLGKRDRKALEVLHDPAKAATADERTLARVVTPSKRLGELLDMHPELAANRGGIVQALGRNEGAAASARTRGETAAEIARAALRPPVTPQRTITLPGGEVVHPLASKSRAVAALQARYDRRASERLADEEGRLGASLVERATGGRLSPETMAGMELAAARRVTDAKELASVSRLESFGATRPARLLKRTTGVDLGSLFSRRGQLSAGEQKAIDVVASGLSPAEHVAYHERAMELARQGVKEYGRAEDHALQIDLIRAAGQHLEASSDNLSEAIRLTRDLIGKREKILGLEGEEIARRVGARAAEMRALVSGQESPLVTRARLETELRELGSLRGDTAAISKRLEEIEATLAGYRTTPRSAERAVVGTGGPKPQDLDYAALRREGSELKTKLDTLNRQAELEFEIELLDFALMEAGEEALSRGGFYLPSKAHAPSRRARVPASSVPVRGVRAG